MSAFWRRFVRSRSAVLGLAIVVAVILLAASAPIAFPGSPFRPVDRPFLPPFGSHLFGTDVLGRDVAAGIAHGARTSLLIGLLATAVAVLVGVVTGGVAGYYGGRIDDALMRVTEFFQTIPTFLFAILLVAILTPSIRSIVAAIAVVSWPAVARLVRGEFMAMRHREFVQACVCLGMSDGRVIFRHILPNCLSPIIVTGSLIVATAILIESALSFLGLGDPNTMSWGFMIGAGRTFLRTAWWLCTIPGVAILLTVLAINLLGEGLNDTLNPRLRHR
ncbi:MAG TPA: ABC transporter permease [Methylomirabilota bacterium]|jgi:peptide/nickel transport system permease protein|nr:ABC transporter permease [Methylomirabilota bacterium]